MSPGVAYCQRCHDGDCYAYPVPHTWVDQRDDPTLPDQMPDSLIAKLAQDHPCACDCAIAPATRASAAPGDAQGTGPAPEAGASGTDGSAALTAADTLTLAAIAAVKRAVDAEQAEIYISGGKGRIEFTDDSFAAWYAAERAQIAQEARAKIAEEARQLIADQKAKGAVLVTLAGLDLFAEKLEEITREGR